VRGVKARTPLNQLLVGDRSYSSARVEIRASRSNFSARFWPRRSSARRRRRGVGQREPSRGQAQLRDFGATEARGLRLCCPRSTTSNANAIFLDLDGTVAELVAHPDSVHVDRSTLRLLEMLSEKVGRALAIVSGREIAVVDRLLRPLVLPSLACTDWSVATPEESSIRGTPADISSIIFDIEKAIGHEVGVAIERKPGAIALHYRLRPELERRCRDIVHGVVEKRSDLCLLQGKMVYEIMRGAATKAVRSKRSYPNLPSSDADRFSPATISPTRPGFPW